LYAVTFMTSTVVPSRRKPAEPALLLTRRMPVDGAVKRVLEENPMTDADPARMLPVAVYDGAVCAPVKVLAPRVAPP
jgi:hypothetical protein